MLDDKLLVWKFNRGNRAVLHVIYDKYKADLLALAVALLNNRAGGEDVVHDVFVTFIEKAGRFQLTGSLKGYLLTCVANRARNVNSRACNRMTVGLEDRDFIDPVAAGPAEATLSTEQWKLLADCLGRIPYEQREVILLRLRGGLKFREIAKMRRVPISTIQGQYRYGLQKLRTLMKDEAQSEIRR